ncbi:Chitin deacetylase [Ceratobasidium theobromae]|uniref:chitin deacetylase n=1 Tax=Ceratobasidium theobromae TaxID=1582974 RepID=A0A5N5QTU0_9AGAM|nr:Chitin deacetylase [Ceratobasidium theobromae]
MLGLIIALLAAPAVLAHPIEHAHVEARSLGARWWHEPGHPVHGLFARQSNSSAPAVGSPAWAKQYPAGKLTTAGIPQAWLDALDKAVSDGRIPSNVPVATQAGGGAPTYQNSSGTMNPGKQPICSSSAQCRGDGQIYDVPDGIVALSFDDGPLPACQNVLGNPDLFLEAFETNGDDIAVHTWTHPYMTTLSNEMVLAELGWTMKIIHDSSGGRVPRFWRPPYGDSDNRVRAIARQEVLGLTTVIWNDDTNDWAITAGTQTVAGATKILQKAYSGPKSPGLCILEHELSDQSVSVFINTFPLIAQNGWTAKSIPDAVGTSWYLNAEDDTSDVTPLDIAQPAPSVGATTGGNSSGNNGTTTSGGSSGGSSNSTAATTSAAPSTITHASSASPVVAWSSWLGLAAMLPMTLTLF